MAQPGSAPEWGSGGRGFKSRRPDSEVEVISGFAHTGCRSSTARFAFLYVPCTLALIIDAKTAHAVVHGGKPQPDPGWNELAGQPL